LRGDAVALQVVRSMKTWRQAFQECQRGAAGLLMCERWKLLWSVRPGGRRPFGESGRRESEQSKSSREKREDGRVRFWGLEWANLDPPPASSAAPCVRCVRSSVVRFSKYTQNYKGRNDLSAHNAKTNQNLVFHSFFLLNTARATER
jgi:hypothetical protein